MGEHKQCAACGQPLPDDFFLAGLCPRCLAKMLSTLVLPPGTNPRFGDYELLEEIGRGGMGVVYRARQVSLGRTVAVKMMVGGHLASQAEIQRFHAEAEAGASLEHPNIVAIYDIAVQDGQPYFSMQWVNGRNLAAEACNATSRFGNRRAAELLLTLAWAVHHAHQRGVLHRDLKPANVLLDSRGEPHVSDFGLARSLGANRHLTVSGSVLGSPGFMAPEQAAGKAEQLTTAVDIYGLGAILYFLLTGRPPFAEVTELETLRSLLEREPARPRSLNPQADRDLETICLKCLEKDPQRRYASADALAEELERWLRREPIRARRAGAAEHVLKWARRKPVVALLFGVVLFLAAAGFAAVSWQWRQTERARRRAARAEQEAVRELYASYLAQARALRWSGQPGRRSNGLEVVRKAAAIRPSLELRNVAIACLALPGVRVERRLHGASLIAPGGLAFDAELRRYAQALPGGGITLRRADDDRKLLELVSPRKPAWAGLDFSPNGRWLAERYFGPQTNRVLVWDLRSARAVLSKAMTCRCVAFPPRGGQVVAVAEDNGLIRFYDLPHGQELRHLKMPPGLNAVIYDPEGRRLAVARAQNPTVLIIDAASGHIEQRFNHPAAIGLAAWSPDGRWLACPCADGRTYLRQTGTGKLEAVLQGHVGSVTASLFNREGDILVTSAWDGTTRFWDPKLGCALFSLPGRWVPIAFGPGGRLGFSVGNREAGIWRVEPARECRSLGRTGVIWGGRFSPDGSLLAVACTDGIYLWQLPANHLVAHLPAQHCRSALFTPDGRHLLVSGWTGLSSWTLQWAEPFREPLLGAPTSLCGSSLESCGLASDGRTLIAACRSGPDLLSFDLAHPGCPVALSGHRMAASVSISPDGKWFATGTWKGNGVKVWDASVRRPVQELPVKGNAVPLFSPDGCWLVTGSAQEYRFWRVPSWQPGPAIPRNHAGDMYGAMAFSPDGRMLALLRGRNSGLELISAPDGAELATLHTGQPLCFSCDGRFLATAGDDLRSVFLWDLGLIRKELGALSLDW